MTPATHPMADLPTSGVGRWCTCRIGDACFAIEAGSVTEVIRGGRIVPVPLAPQGVRGLVHLRGSIVPIIDLADRLGLPPARDGRPETHLVVTIQQDLYGLAVDEVLDVVDVPAGRIEHPTDAALSHEALVGVFAEPHRLVHLLDPERMIQSLVRPRTVTHPRPGATHGG